MLRSKPMGATVRILVVLLLGISMPRFAGSSVTGAWADAVSMTPPPVDDETLAAMSAPALALSPVRVYVPFLQQASGVAARAAGASVVTSAGVPTMVPVVAQAAEEPALEAAASSVSSLRLYVPLMLRSGAPASSADNEAKGAPTQTPTAMRPPAPAPDNLVAPAAVESSPTVLPTVPPAAVAGAPEASGHRIPSSRLG